MQASIVATDLEVDVESVGICFILARIVLVLQADKLNALFVNLFYTFEPVEHIGLLKGSVAKRILAKRVFNVVQGRYRSA